MILNIFLAINWSEVGLLVGQLLLSLSILIILHEFGHFITAKWFKVRVEKFYLFFDAGFSLLKKKIGETVYGIGWLPLGGYVKLAGMVDESMDKEQMKQPPQPWEFRSKPAWQRLIVMVAGVVMNILVAFVIYAFVLMHYGDKKIPTDSMKYGLAFNDSLFQKFGFQTGDKILNIDGKPVDDFEKLVNKLIVVDDSVVVERNGQRVNLPMPVDFIGQLIEHKRNSKGALIEPRLPVVVSEVADSSPVKGKLLPMDYITSVNGQPTEFNDQFLAVMNGKKKGDSVLITVSRNGQPVSIATTLLDEGKIGFARNTNFAFYDSLGVLKFNVKKYGFLEAFPAGVKMTGEKLGYYIDQFKKILNPSTGAYKGVGGFKGMSNVFSKTEWNWEQFWNMTAFFSIILAFMNILPIPALDGGHVMFTLYEMITGRKPSEKFLEYAQIAGMIILLALMLYANGNDWFGWGRGK